jgi:hypothetical protein
MPEREIGSVHVHIENDLFAVRNLDRAYTGGLAITLSGTAARDGRRNAWRSDRPSGVIQRTNSRRAGAHHFFRSASRATSFSSFFSAKSFFSLAFSASRAKRSTRRR